MTITEVLLSSEVYPIRVIDVEQTICSSNGSIIFHKPTGWDFHTISHTWSKGVQSWSDTIGDSLPSSSASDNPMSYEDLFSRKDFRRHNCYAPFIEFLVLLQADEVRYVWLDALCINQASESGELNQELRNMGSYYGKSAGCYVCAHGFGEGFHTWTRIRGTHDTKLLLPRWFNRVWTLQESLLPCRVTFIFHLSQILVKTINSLISDLQHKGVHSPCKCVLGGSHRKLPCPLFLSDLSSYDDDDMEKQHVEIACAASCSACPRCGGAGLIRKPRLNNKLQALIRRLAHRYRTPEASVPASGINSDLYFIERECIVDLMVMDLVQQRKVLPPADEPGEAFSDNTEDEKSKLSRWKTITEQLIRSSEQESGGYTSSTDILCVCEPVQVVLETARRDCTREEDRVLAIVGLLGIEGVVQLRAGKRLEEQLLDMAQQLVRSGRATALVKLCMAQFAGSSAKGMSWAPTLNRGIPLTGEQVVEDGQERRATPLRWREKRRLKLLLAPQREVQEGCDRAVVEQGHVMRYFVEDLKVECVQDDGVLRLSQAKVLWDCAFVRQEQESKHFFHLHVFDRDGSVAQEYAFEAYFSPLACLLHRGAMVGVGDNMLTHQSIVWLDAADPEHHQSGLTQFRVHLVLLGHLLLPGDAVHEVSMVCIGRHADRPLRKIGIAWLIPSLERLFQSLPYSHCRIG